MPHKEREIYLVGLNHRTAGVQVREAFALSGVPMLEDNLLPVARAHAHPEETCREERPHRAVANYGDYDGYDRPDGYDGYEGEAPLNAVSAAGVACLAGQYSVSPDVILAGAGSEPSSLTGLTGSTGSNGPAGSSDSSGDSGQTDQNGQISQPSPPDQAELAVQTEQNNTDNPESSSGISGPSGFSGQDEPTGFQKAGERPGEGTDDFSGRPELREAMVLSTCNRVEILAVGARGADETIIRHWAEACGKKPEELRPYVYRYSGAEAVRHLFTVASSLDSMVLGEPQILGQLKSAYKSALGLGTTKIILNRLLHRAFSVAKRVRSETGVASSAVSISYAAVELAKRIFGDMSAYRAMLIGAGEMAELAATHLINAGIKSVWVANRTHERAAELAARWDSESGGRCEGRAVPFSELFEQLHEVDIVISSTGAPEAIISARDMGAVMRKRRNRPMFFIDIAVPRDIDPDVNGLDNIYLYDIDDLKEVVEENLAQRQEEAVKARAIVEEEAEAFLRWQGSLGLQPTIIELIRRTEQIAGEELNRTLRKLDVDEETEQALRAMLRSIAKKLNHKPITFLKRRHEEEEAGMEYLGIVRRIFDLDGDKIPPDAHADRKRPR